MKKKNAQDRCYAYADTRDQSNGNLSRLLKLIDYSKGYFFLSIRSELATLLTTALDEANAEIAESGPTLLYHLSKEDALKFNVE